MSDLPNVALQAGVLLQNPLALQDAEYRKTIIDWGRQQIEAEYPLDPIRAPLNGIRRKLALMEWDRVVRTNGKELRGVVAGAAVAELQFQLQRRQSQILAQDAEIMRRGATEWDAEQQYKVAVRLAELELKRTELTLRLQHELSESTEDNASRRRKEEAINETEQAINKLLVEAAVKATGANGPEEIIRATNLVHAEIRKIRHDPDLTPDEQHLHIKSLLDTLPQMLRGMRSHDI